MSLIVVERNGIFIIWDRTRSAYDQHYSNPFVGAMWLTRSAAEAALLG